MPYTVVLKKNVCVMAIESKKESPDYIGDVGEKFEGAKGYGAAY